jgi:hypothetical protein
MDKGPNADKPARITINLRPFGEAARESHDISRFLDQAPRVD